MHKIAGLGVDGRTPYNGAANNKNINYGVVRNYNMMNERGANMYAREISKKYGLGPIIEDGGVPLEGISKAGRPWNEGPAHYYPDGKNMQEYFDQGAKHLNQLKTKTPGSAEAMDTIADYYQVRANARPFDNINNSLFMTQTNTLLSEFGFSPMTHGYLDHLAQRLSPEQFRKVVHRQSNPSDFS